MNAIDKLEELPLGSRISLIGAGPVNEYRLIRVPGFNHLSRYGKPPSDKMLLCVKNDDKGDIWNATRFEEKVVADEPWATQFCVIIGERSEP